MAPAQERITQVQDLVNQWEQLVGFTVSVPDALLQEMAATTGYKSSAVSPIQVDIGHAVMSLYDVGQYMLAHVNTAGAAYGALTVGADVLQNMPWAFYGLSADSYHSQATTYATEYKKITGQDIPADQLAKAFSSLKDATGGLLSGSEYAQQLIADQTIQKTYGWVQYGLDFQQFQQQKLAMRSSFGRDLSDAEATVQLQYLHSAQGADHAARAQTPQAPQKPVGVGQSEVR